jgi:hypothetical protein
LWRIKCPWHRINRELKGNRGALQHLWQLLQFIDMRQRNHIRAPVSLVFLLVQVSSFEVVQQVIQFETLLCCTKFALDLLEHSRWRWLWTAANPRCEHFQRYHLAILLLEALRNVVNQNCSLDRSCARRRHDGLPSFLGHVLHELRPSRLRGGAR